MKKYLAIMLFSFLTVPAVQAMPTKITGVLNADFEKLRSKGLLRQNPTLSQADQILRAIYAFGNYEAVTLEAVNARQWVIVAQPTRTISDIEFDGNEEFSDSRLEDFLNIESDSKLDREQLRRGAERVKSEYGKKGYLNAIISVEFQDLPNNRVNTLVKVAEGPQTIVKEINFLTSNRKLEGKLKGLASDLVDEPMEQSRITGFQEEIQTFLTENRYITANLKGPDLDLKDKAKTATLTYSLERPFQYTVYIDVQEPKELQNETNRKMPPTSGEIREAINVDKRDGLGINPSPVLASRIESFLKSRGYSQAIVRYRENLISSSFERQLFFTAETGYLTRIQNLQIISENSERSKEYEKFLRENSSELIKRNIYYRQDLEKGVESLVTWLLNQGYLGAKSQGVREEYTNDGKSVNVMVILDEGPQTRVRNLSVTGNKVISTRKILEFLKLKNGSPLQLNFLEEGLEKIVAHLRDKGHLDAFIKTPKTDIVQYLNSNEYADIVFELYEGPKVEVSRILVEGNDQTKDYVVLNELAFDVGDTLTPNKIQESQYRLEKTGLFSRVDITLPEAGTRVRKRNVFINVTERDPGAFNFGVGVSNEFNLTLRGFTGISYKNIGGTARGASARVELKQVTDVDFLEHAVSTGYYEPFIFGTRTRGRVNLLNSRDIFERGEITADLTIREVSTSDFLLERELSRNVQLTYSLWRLEVSKRFREISGAVIESQNIGSTGPRIEFDYRNDPFNPSAGTYSQFAADYGSPELGSTRQIRYIRTTGGFNYYLPIIGKDLVLAHLNRGGYVSNLNQGVSEVPEARAFFLGGRATIRGFDPSSIPSQREILGSDASALTIPTDSHFYLTKFELRFPIFGILGGVAFYDGGAVKISGREIEDEYRDSAGLGLRINTPVGPLSVEYGYKLDRKRDVETDIGRLHISFGTF